MTKPGWWERWRARRAERRQLRTWRRERRKGSLDADASDKSRSGNYESYNRREGGDGPG